MLKQVPYTGLKWPDRMMTRSKTAEMTAELVHQYFATLIFLSARMIGPDHALIFFAACRSFPPTLFLASDLPAFLGPGQSLLLF
jgi:hypothetical protein